MEQNNNDQSLRDAVRDAMQDAMRDQHQMMQQMLQTMQAMMARMEVQNRAQPIREEEHDEIDGGRERGFENLEAPPIRREQQRRDVGLPRYVDQPPFFENQNRWEASFRVEIPEFKRENAQESCAVDTPQTNLACTDEKTDLDEFMASSTSYEENGHTCMDENERGNLTKADSLVIRTSSLVVPSVDDKEFSEIPSDGTAVDVISDDEKSWMSESGSPSTTISDTENEGYLEHPISDICYTMYGDMVDDVIVFPDYVIYENMLYGESRIIFFADCIKIECSDTSGNEKLVLECAIANIIYIHRQWSRSVEAALVKLRLRASAVTGSEKPHNDGDVKIIFAVADMCWFEKEQKIRNLAERYGDIWNVLPNDDLVGEDDALVTDMLFSRQCFTEIVEPFEDVIYPKGDPDAVSISKRDVELLQPETFINDTIIDFYIKYLKNKIEPNEKHRFHFFNSFFFRKLADLDKDPGSASKGRAAFLRVRKWTRKVNIFAKDYIFIPVNFNLHWSLLVICHPGEVATSEDDDIKDSSKVPCILHMDSIKGSHTGLKNVIQSYLLEEWKERHPESSEDYSSKFSNLRFVSLELPQQENLFDCGLFLLHYVELFLEEAPANFSPSKITMFSSFLGADWFSPVEASLKRTVIRNLIHDLLKDSSQKIAPTTCNNGHLSSGFPEVDVDVDHEPIIEFFPEQCDPAKAAASASIAPETDKGNENDVEQVPVLEFFPEPCSPARPVVGDSSGAATDRGMQIELLTSSNVTSCDKQVGLTLQEFPEPGATRGSYLELQENACQQDEPFQKLAPTGYLEHVDRSMQLVSSSLDEDGCGPQGGSPNSQICLTSYSTKIVGANGTSWNSMQEKEVNITALESFNMNLTDSDKNHEAGKTGSILPDNLGYVPDSPSLSSGEKLDGCVEDPRETDTVKVKIENHQDSQLIDAMNCDSGVGGDCIEVGTSEGMTGDDGACQEPSATEAEYGDGGNCQVLEKFGDNAYRVELPDDVFISDVFNIRHLTPYAGENSSLRSSFSEEGESDEDISSDQSSGQSNQALDVPVPATQNQQTTSGKPTPGSLRRSKRLQNKRA